MNPDPSARYLEHVASVLQREDLTPAAREYFTNVLLLGRPYRIDDDDVQRDIFNELPHVVWRLFPMLTGKDTPENMACDYEYHLTI